MPRLFVSFSAAHAFFDSDFIAFLAIVAHCGLVAACFMNMRFKPAMNFSWKALFFTVQYMLWTIAVILLILWFIGLVTAHTIGGFIHLLLVIAIIVVLIRVIRGEKIVG